MIELQSAGSLGEIIRSTRRRQHMTQTQLAGVCNTTQKYISDLEGGKETVQFDLAFRVMRALGLRILIEQPTGDEL